MTETKGPIGLRGIVEVRASLASSHRPPVVSADVKAASGAMARMGMQGAGVQPRTLAAQRAVPTPVEHVALIKDNVRGETKVVRHTVLAFFERSANPVFRLINDNLITGMGGMAAYSFAAAGDRVLGAVRVRTVNLEGLPGMAGSATPDADKDAVARKRWADALSALRPDEFRVLDGVMRHDEGVVKAASAARPQIRNRNRLQGMGDEMIVSACMTLAEIYGFQSRAQALRELAGE